MKELVDSLKCVTSFKLTSSKGSLRNQAQIQNLIGILKNDEGLSYQEANDTTNGISQKIFSKYKDDYSFLIIQEALKRLNFNLDNKLMLSSFRLKIAKRKKQKSKALFQVDDEQKVELIMDQVDDKQIQKINQEFALPKSIDDLLFTRKIQQLHV